MSLNTTPSSERIHIGFFGTRNAGKSSIINKFANQNLSIVSDLPGTTTDPVYKAMELLPLGPVMLIDTAGIDDEGALGGLRIKKTLEVLRKTDIAVLVINAAMGPTSYDTKMLETFKEAEVPFVIALNKLDLCTGEPAFKKATEVKSILDNDSTDIIPVCAASGEGIDKLKNAVIKSCVAVKETTPLVSDIVSSGDLVVLVIPIDSAAPKGRIILPQQQTIRALLDVGAITLVCTPDKLKDTINASNKRPALVITDSQVFEAVNAIVPDDIMLTSFSILMARYKGYLKTALYGIDAIDRLKEKDRILICEGCTHHRQCEDIGTVKIPNWLKKYTGLNLTFDFCSGREFPDDLSDYALVIHCGACMLNEREVHYRMNSANSKHVPFTNYGIIIAKMKGILERTTEIFS